MKSVLIKEFCKNSTKGFVVSQEGIVQALIVDEIESNRIVVHALCDRIKALTAKEASNWQDAAKLAKILKPDILLTEVNFSDGNCIDRLRQIKSDMPDIGIFIITDSQDENMQALCTKLGFDGYFQNPLNKKLLKLKLESFSKIVMHSKHVEVLPNIKTVFTPFEDNVRRIKVFFEIADESDIATLEAWMNEKTIDEQVKLDFEAANEAIMLVLMHALANPEPIKIIIEENDAYIFVSIVMSRFSTKDLKQAIEASKSALGVSFVKYGKMLYFALSKVYHDVKPVILDASNSFVVHPDEERLMRISSYDTTVSAKDYIQMLTPARLDDINDLADLELEWELALNNLIIEQSDENVEMLARAISAYSSIVNDLCEFEALGYGLNTLASLIRSVNLSKISSNLDLLSIYLKATLNDLINWKKTIFIEQTAANIRYLDASLFSSFVQLEALLSDKAIIHNDSEIEFF